MVLDIVKTYPTDGTHKYHWVSGFDGVTEDLYYNNVLIAKSEEQKRTYCCGLTFEVWFKLGSYKGTVQDLKKLKRDWYVASGKRKGPVDALVPRGLATEIEDIEDAMPGDFVQLWRKSGSGHSVIFIRHVENGFEYFSTQPSTDGIGYRTEYFTGKNPVTETYIARWRSR